jgi:hypothetical protein
LVDISSIKTKIAFNLQVVNNYFSKLKQALSDKADHLSSEGIGWLGTMLIHCATIPSLLGLIFAVSDALPSLDVVLFIWFGLLLFFIKALINRDMLSIITHGIGFFIQAVLLGIVVFK